MSDVDGDDVIRHRLVCRGVVQGVGFRPAVWRLATDVGAAGLVRNDDEGATVEVEGPRAKIAEFETRLRAALPPLARLDDVSVTELPPRGDRTFDVVDTRATRRGRALTPPDVALCAACRAEMEDPGDRRSRYPFTTCTDCGPRFSVIRSLPYDRVRTSMACFPLCARCADEYGDPASRRFHAEPVCCSVCGPRLWACRASGNRLGAGGDALEIARRALALGEIVAVKGIGGFQLCCRADAPEAVRRLRERKRRGGKPFAVMARDLHVARRICELRPEDEELLTSREGPILLAPRRADGPVTRAVAPGLDDLGVMLPTTPLHVELLRAREPQAIVATSGNASDEPICVGNREALRRLRGIADIFLLHDRDIVRRVDDSVVRTMPRGHVLMRRSRGHVPRALPLPESVDEAVLALGGHLQATACVAYGNEAFLSQHVGDLDTEPARAFLLEVADGLETFLEVEGEVVAADLHPDYASTWAAEEVARKRGGRVVRVQHHVAHAAAVLAEHGAFPAPGERAHALVLDGTGFGTDDTAWGSEWLSIDGDLRWARVAHGDEVPLVGGEHAVREPWRVAVGALARSGWDVARIARLPLAELVDPRRLAKVAELAAGAWPRACGAGRIFEAAGAILGLATENLYEGEAAARLEALASRASRPEPWREVTLVHTSFPSVALLTALARRAFDGQDLAEIAHGFHVTFCSLAARLSARAFGDRVRTIALGGGCLVNRLLHQGLAAEHVRAGIEVLHARRAPPGDGGLSYGQAVLAATALARGIPIPDAPLSPGDETCASPSP